MSALLIARFDDIEELKRSCDPRTRTDHEPRRATSFGELRHHCQSEMAHFTSWGVGFRGRTREAAGQGDERSLGRGRVSLPGADLTILGAARDRTAA